MELGYEEQTAVVDAAPTVDPIDFASVARLPEPADNVAIARRTIFEGSTLRHGDGTTGLTYTLPHRVLEFLRDLPP